VGAPVADAIVVTYRSRDSIGDCLEPLVAAGLDVHVVDNCPGDGAAELVRERFPGVDLIANPENRGFPAAVNQALARSSGDVVFLVNPDCVAPPETLQALAAYVREHDDVAIAAPRLRAADGSVSITARPLDSFANLLVNRLRRFVPGLAPLLGRTGRYAAYEVCLDATEPTRVGMVVAACVAVRGSFLRELGGLDEGYFMYCEDMELCLEAARRRLAVVYLPQVEAAHTGGGSSGDRSHVWPIHSRSLLRFHARHHPRSFALVRATLLGRALLGLALGLGQDGLAALGVRPRRRRTLAWARIARLAATTSRRRAALPWNR
jgi:N-acetylglucosaminyl-diphospho-decaprenol L-rhamnosyltransferase